MCSALGTNNGVGERGRMGEVGGPSLVYYSQDAGIFARLGDLDVSLFLLIYSIESNPHDDG